MHHLATPTPTPTSTSTSTSNFYLLQTNPLPYILYSYILILLSFIFYLLYFYTPLSSSTPYAEELEYDILIFLLIIRIFVNVIFQVIKIDLKIAMRKQPIIPTRKVSYTYLFTLYSFSFS